MFAARAAAEIRARQQDRCAFVARKVQHEFGVRFLPRQITPVVEENLAEALARQRLQELFWHHLVGVHVDAVQRRDHARVSSEWLHLVWSPKLSAFSFPSSYRALP